MNKTIVTVYGNIGSGKSTLLNRIKCELDIDIYTEPIHVWNNLKSDYDDILTAIYNEPKKYMFEFQLYVCIVYMNGLKKLLRSSDKKLIMVERGLWDIENVFIDTAVESGMYSDNNILILRLLLEELRDSLKGYREIGIFLDVPVEKCYKQIQQRNRISEQNISIEYLRSLDERYQRLYSMPNIKLFSGITDLKEYLDSL